MAVLLAAGGVQPSVSGQQEPPLWETGTFSILGYDPATGEMGGAVQSRVFSVGNGVLWADASAGVAATQAIVDVGYGPMALELLRTGVAPDAIVKQIWAQDPDPLPDNWTKQGRQFAVMNLKGEYAAFTGPKATEWAGHTSGKFATAQGKSEVGSPKSGRAQTSDFALPTFLRVRPTAPSGSQCARATRRCGPARSSPA